MTTELEQELTQACGLKISKGGDRQAYLIKLVKAVNELDDDTWNTKLSTAAQNWQNAAIEAHTQEQAIPDFMGDDAEAEEEEEEEEEVVKVEEVVTASAAPVKAKKEKPVAKTVKRTESSNGKDKAVTKKLVTKPTKTAKPEKSGVPATLVIQDMVLKNVNVTNKELAAALLKKGRGEVSASSISGMAYTMREMLRAAEKAGMLKRPLPRP